MNTYTCKWFTPAPDAAGEDSPEFPFANRPAYASCRCPQVRGQALVTPCDFIEEADQPSCAYFDSIAKVHRSATLNTTHEDRDHQLVVVELRKNLEVNFVVHIITRTQSPVVSIPLMEAPSLDEALDAFNSLTTSVVDTHEWITGVVDDNTFVNVTPLRSYIDTVVPLPQAAAVAV